MLLMMRALRGLTLTELLVLWGLILAAAYFAPAERLPVPPREPGRGIEFRDWDAGRRPVIRSETPG